MGEPIGPHVAIGGTRARLYNQAFGYEFIAG
jgi:hypothetical protein